VEEWMLLFLKTKTRPFLLLCNLEKKGQIKKLFFGFKRFVFRENRRDGFCGYGTPDKRGKLPAVVDMGQLETDDESEAEAGYGD
jgi:hypothetical protein